MNMESREVPFGARRLPSRRAFVIAALFSGLAAACATDPSVGPAMPTTEAVEALHGGPCARDAVCARSRFVRVRDSYLHYREAGNPRGKPIVLLHGQPTWSYVYRNIIPDLPADARIIAPDTIGYGFSGRPDIEYSWTDHVEYLEGFVAALGLRDLTLVVHDLGSFQGLAYASRHPENVRGIVMMESLLAPIPSWEALRAQFPAGTPQGDFVDFLALVKSDSAAAERLIVEENVFIEQLLPAQTLRRLSAREMAAYRAPFASRESRFKMMTIPLGMPVAGAPADNHALVARYAEYLATSDVPKLLLYSDPGLLFSPQTAPLMASMLRNTRAESIGAGRHFVQEDQPQAIAAAVTRFFRALPAAPR
jgi:haloalkane dehalogenase